MSLPTQGTRDPKFFSFIPAHEMSEDICFLNASGDRLSLIKVFAWGSTGSQVLLLLDCEDSDQTAMTHRLICVFVGRTYCDDSQADLRLCWAHTLR